MMPHSPVDSNPEPAASLTTAWIEDAGTWTVTGCLEALAEGRVSLAEVVEVFLGRADGNADLNGFITLERDLVRETAGDERWQGTPLRGLPLVLKDNIHAAGLPNTAGTPALRSFVPRDDAACVHRWRAAGGAVFGKANMHELALGITSANAAFGWVRNPHLRSCYAGGSSGGTAALVAAGVVPAGLGTDTGGSARIPAALCGLCGFRPTTGRYPGQGVTPLSSTRDTVGPMAHTVQDIILLDAVLVGYGPEVHGPVAREPRGLRLGVPTSYFTEPLCDDVAEVWAGALRKLQEAGAALIPVDAEGALRLSSAVDVPIVLYEVRAELAWYLDHYETGVDLAGLVEAIASPDVGASFREAILPESPHVVGESEYAQALAARPRLQLAYQSIFDRHRIDGLIYPTTPSAARDLEAEARVFPMAGETVSAFATFTRNTVPSTLAGLPSLTLPMGVTPSGLPVGLCIDGPRGADVESLAVGLSLEAVLG